MVGGTSFPPHDSESEPWSNEQKAKATPKPSTKGKSKPEAALPERSRLATRSLEVSLDNADRVIEGAARTMDIRLLQPAKCPRRPRPPSRTSAEPFARLSPP